MRLILLHLIAAAASAQSFELRTATAPVQLAGDWRYHAGDDPRWAARELDDSGWTKVRMPEEGLAWISGQSWYRFRIRPAPGAGTEPLALLVGLFGSATAIEVFANGRPVGRQGDPGGGIAGLLTARPFLVSLGQPEDGEIVVALRVHRGAAPNQLLLSAARSVSWTGVPQDLEIHQRAWTGDLLRDLLPLLLLTMGLGVLSVFFLGVGLWQGDMRDLGWLGCFLAASTITHVLAYFPGFALGSAVGMNSAVMVAVIVLLVFWAELCRSLFHGRWSGALILVTVLAFASYFVPFALFLAGRTYSPTFLGIVLLMPPSFMALAYGETAWRQQARHRAMTSLDATVILYVSALVVGYLLQFVDGTRGGSIREQTIIQAAVLRQSALAVFAVAMLASLNQRARRIRHERARLGQELEAGAAMQSALLALAEQAPGFAVEAVYWPASEVGGDFHYSLRDDGALLILMGDVSGKGLKAAMLVSMITGILRQATERQPGALLAALNRALTGQTRGGFVTCCCARFDASGSVTVANAGHLAPYGDGREVAVEAGLPLGVLAEAEYTESVVRGKRFTFVSDGVVEAENAQRELFGFDRTRAISTQSAQAIAETAKQWGQNDDITVVTVRRTDA